MQRALKSTFLENTETCTNMELCGYMPAQNQVFISANKGEMNDITTVHEGLKNRQQIMLIE